MESKIIHTSVSICESDTVIVATCEDGSVWTSSNFHSFEPFEKPFKVAQKKEEAPETIDNTTKAKIQPCQRSLDCAHERVTGKCLGPECGVYLPAEQ